MSYKINLGSWGSVFAVPSCVVDAHLKIASAYQLKVLLYLLKNNNVLLDEKIIADALSMHPDDVKDSLSFWVDRGVIAIDSNVVTPCEGEAQPAHQPNVSTTVVSQVVTATVELEEKAEEKEESKRPRPMTRAIRPEPAHVIKRLGSDPALAMLMDETQRIFGRVISNTDAGILVMLHDTDGLPVEVILMLLQYCADSDKANMRTVERLGIQWASQGINTVALAEEKIRSLTESYSMFNRVSSIFGLRNVGSPTKQQLSYAEQWLSKWNFSEDMLRLAYERCVDTKGQLNLSYINGILKRWYEAGWKNPEQVDSEPAPSTTVKPKKTKKSSKKDFETEASYDIDEYENKSIFD